MNTSREFFLQGGDELCEFGRQHKQDAELIRQVLVERGFLNAGLDDAVWLWNEYSEDVYNVKWSYVIPDGEDIYNNVEPYIRKFIYPDPL